MTKAPPKAQSKRRRRWPWLLLGAVLLLIVAVAVALPLLLDVDRYRGSVQQALASATGWDAEIGDLELSLIRGMALTVQPAKLQDPEGHSSLEVDTVAVHAGLRSLLQGRLEVRSIELSQPRIEIVRPSAERGWVLPGILAQEEGGGESTETPSSGKGPIRVAIDEIRIRDGSVHLRDLASTPEWRAGLDNLDVTLHPGSLAIEGSAALTDEGGLLSWSGSLDSALELRIEQLRSEWLHPWIGAGLVHSGATFDGEVRVELPSMLDGSLQGTGLKLLAGTQPFDASNVAFRIVGTADGWTLERLVFQGDGVTVRGQGSLYPQLDLQLEMPSTGLETTLEAAKSVLPLPLELVGPGQVEARLSVDRPEGEELGYNARGRLAAARFEPGSPLPAVTDLVADFELNRRGQLEIRIDQGSMAGGPVAGIARLASVDPPGKLSFEGGMREATLGGLLGGFVAGASERVAGPTTAEATVGLDLGSDTFELSDLSGRLKLSSTTVSLPGWDLEQALLTKLHEELGPLSQLAGLTEPEPGTEEKRAQLLDDIRLELDFDSWPWKLADLALTSGDVTASGAGSFDPASGEITLDLTSTLATELTTKLVAKNRELRYLVDDSGRISLPLGLSGPMLSPSIRVELDDVLMQQLLGDDPEEKVKGLLRGLFKKKN